MTSRNVAVVNQLGMHARAAAKFVHLATRFRSQSIMGILLLAAACGSTITITADGADEHEAVAALTALVESGFGEEPGCDA
jgi:phosphocarrier protein